MRLRVREVAARHGAVPALHGVSLAVDGGEVVALLGANGSGRTTLLRTVSGLLRPTAGEVLLDGRPLHRRGLAPLAVEEVLRLRGEVAAAGTAVLLVEQDVGLALGAAARGYVLETGRVVAQGPAAQLAADPAVAQAYLGG